MRILRAVAGGAGSNLSHRPRRPQAQLRPNAGRQSCVGLRVLFAAEGSPTVGRRSSERPNRPTVSSAPSTLGRPLPLGGRPRCRVDAHRAGHGCSASHEPPFDPCRSTRRGLAWPASACRTIDGQPEAGEATTVEAPDGSYPRVIGGRCQPCVALRAAGSLPARSSIGSGNRPASPTNSSALGSGWRNPAFRTCKVASAPVAHRHAPLDLFPSCWYEWLQER